MGEDRQLPNIGSVKISTDTHALTAGPQGNLTKEELLDAIQHGSIDTVVAATVDACGRLVGKRLPAAYFTRSGSAAKYQLAVPLFIGDQAQNFPPDAEVCNFNTGMGNFLAQPDMRTLRRMPWEEKSAVVICDGLNSKTLVDLDYTPRAMLKRQVERLQQRGYTAMMASELEFYLFDETHKAARAKHYRGLEASTMGHRANLIGLTARDEPIMRKVRNGLEGAGVRMEGIMGEYGYGQQELNLCYANALEMADRHVVLKQAVHEIVEREGQCCTFMAKYNNDDMGSSCHIHNSLWSVKEGEKPHTLFHDPADKQYGMSKLMRHWLAGQMRYVKEYAYFLAPCINSYKRLVDNSFAPTRVSWAPENRTTMFRVCGVGEASPSAMRIECRLGGADLNPYLAFAALIAAGLAGIDQELEPPSACEGNAYENKSLPETARTMRDAVEALNGSEMLRKAFGEKVVDHYVYSGRWEMSEFDKRVTDWELERGFDRA